MKYPLNSRTITKGDRIGATIRAFVREIHADGTVDLAYSREPYAEPAVVNVPADALRLMNAAPAEPMVGDTITGRTVRETAWRRGTTIVDRTAGGETEGDTLVLLGCGEWVNVDATGDELGDSLVSTFAFGEFLDDERFEVVLAPGKQTRPATPPVKFGPAYPMPAESLESLEHAFTRHAYPQRFVAGPF